MPEQEHVHRWWFDDVGNALCSGGPGNCEPRFYLEGEYTWEELDDGTLVITPKQPRED